MLSGPDSGWQLVVTGQTDHGQAVDATDRSTFRVEPPNILLIERGGLVTPLHEGQAEVIVRVDDLETRVAFLIRNIENPHKLDFVTDVAPLFTRHGCNSGGCHGKKGGQDGFELALLGFEPELDYDRLVNEDGGYRLDLEQPDESLLLLNATEAQPHTGGKLFDRDSPAYRVLRRWIKQGAPLAGEYFACVERIEVLPHERILQQGDRQRLIVVAHLSDGSIRDVTRLTTFETNQAEIVEADENGLVSAGDQFGVGAIMARYQTHVGVFRAIVPTGELVDSWPQSGNFVDDLVNRQLQRLGIPASENCDDGTFIRRVTIDIAGRLPTIEETRGFIADSDVQKYARLIDRLLDSDDYASYFASKWAALLHNRRNSPRDPGESTEAFYRWIRDALRENRPYTQFVRGVLTATGKEGECPPVVWYRSANVPSLQSEDVAQLFLGQHLQCARCHHHPLEKWSELDYYGLAAFFSRVEVTQPAPDKKQETLPPIRVSFEPGKALLEHPKTGQPVRPAPLGAAPLDVDDQCDPREALVDWMALPDNRYFSRVLVNRYWKHFMGRGLVEPEDDLRATNPPTNPQLLDALADNFVESGYDLRQLVRVICESQAYRRSSTANDINLHDRQNFSRFLPRRLNAEVLLDAIDTVAASKTQFAGFEAQVRAVELPDNQTGSYFLSIFGRPEGLSVCECERSNSASVAQQLHLLNSPEIISKVCGGRALSLADDPRPHSDRLRELYWLALSRDPTEQELASLLEHIEARADNTAAAYADIVWAVVNTKEFQFDH